MLPPINNKYTKKSKKPLRRYRSAPSVKKYNINQGYSNQYLPSTFNFQSYMTRPFKNQQIKKKSLAMINHKKRILPLMNKFDNLLNIYEQKRFRAPKRIKHVKPKPPPIIEYEPDTGVRAGHNTPINKEVAGKKPTRRVVFDDQDKPPEKSVNLALRERVKELWAKVRRLYRFLQFPLWWYRREYRILTDLRDIILKFQMDNYDEVIEILRTRGMKLAFKSLNSIWYDTLDYNIVFDESILDSYLLGSEASNEDFFVENTQDRANSVQVIFFLIF